MPFDPKLIKKGVTHKARKIIIYGPPKSGKSTLVGSTKNCLMIPTENRIDHIQADKTDTITSYQEMLDIFDFLLQNPTKHSYKRIVIDTLDEWEPLLHKAICEKNGWESLVEDKNKEVNFAKGLKFHAVQAWRKFLNNCDVMRDNGFDIIMVAHSQIIKVNPPDKEVYDKYAMKIDVNALPILEGWADIVGFYSPEIFVKKEKITDKKGKVIASKNRKLHLENDSAAFFCCNSYGLVDVDVPLENCVDIMEWLLTNEKE